MIDISWIEVGHSLRLGDEIYVLEKDANNTIARLQKEIGTLKATITRLEKRGMPIPITEVPTAAPPPSHAFCMKCKKTQVMAEVKARTLTSGRVGWEGKCAECGTITITMKAKPPTIPPPPSHYICRICGQDLTMQVIGKPKGHRILATCDHQHKNIFVAQ